MNYSLVAALIACLVVVHGANIDKRGLLPTLGKILDPLNLLHGGCSKPGPVKPNPNTGAQPKSLSVDLDNALKADCAHPLSADYKKTLQRLEVDANDFMILDPHIPNSEHKEVLMGFTPFAKTTANLTRWANCGDFTRHGLTGIGEELVDIPIELTCNGYYTQRVTDLYEYNAEFNRYQKETIGLANSYQTMAFVNGNILEVHMGDITEGRCKGDHLYIQTVYTNTNLLACVDYSLTTLHITQMNVQITGPSCATQCSIDTTATNLVTVKPGYTNHGLNKM